MNGDELNTAVQSLNDAITTGTARVPAATGSNAVDALLASARSLGIAVGHDRISAAANYRGRDLQECARKLGLTLRRVDLSADPAWATAAAVPLVARVKDRWVALVPGSGRMMLSEPGARSRRVTAAEAKQIDKYAWTVCSRLPDRPSTMRDLARIGWSAASARDCLVLAFSLAACALIGMLTPVVVGRIIGTLVPANEQGRILSDAGILVLAAAATVICLAVSVLVVQRVFTRFELRAGSAVVSRLFYLPGKFHREHQPGELTQRVAGATALTGALTASAPAFAAAISVVVGSLVLLVVMAPEIALLVAVLSAVELAVGLFLDKRVSAASKSYTNASVELAGTVSSMLEGVAKIRVAGAERRFYSRWLSAYAEQQRLARIVGQQRIKIALLSAIPTAGAALVVVAVFAGDGAGGADVGSFATITAAAAQVAAGITGLLFVAASVASALPSITAISPVLDAQPLAGAITGVDPGELSGQVTVSRLRFGYDEAMRIIDDVSLEAEAGSMLAIVGPSGSGKTTLVRLLLGLELPDSGTVLYDGRSLDQLDSSAVRRQIGVVPQNAALITGSILDNILAGSPYLTERDALRAAARAGLADDLAHMPMGVRTVISDGAKTLSGGQRQRILLARVLVRDPKIVILDEATSALDNVTQAEVARSLAELGATRIVVAHRLSTIRYADSIAVLDRGRVVEQGTYSELKVAGGLFAQLAARQEFT